MPLTVQKTYLTNNDCYRAGRSLSVQGLMLHSVGCAQPSATAFVRTWNQPGVKACVHGFIDANTGTVYQTLPWTRRGWHAGGSANNTHIGVEMCEPATLHYTTGAHFVDQNPGYPGRRDTDIRGRSRALCPTVPSVLSGPPKRRRDSLPSGGAPAGHRLQPRRP